MAGSSAFIVCVLLCPAILVFIFFLKKQTPLLCTLFNVAMVLCLFFSIIMAVVEKFSHGCLIDDCYLRFAHTNGSFIISMFTALPSLEAFVGDWPPSFQFSSVLLSFWYRHGRDTPIITLLPVPSHITYTFLRLPFSSVLDDESLGCFISSLAEYIIIRSSD